MAFPTSPSNNQVHKEGNRAFVYDSALGVWDQIAQQEHQLHSRKNDQINLQSFREPPRMPEGSIIQTKYYTGMREGSAKEGSTTGFHTLATGDGDTYFLSSGQMDASSMAATDTITIRQDGSKLLGMWTSAQYHTSSSVSGGWGTQAIYFGHSKYNPFGHADDNARMEWHEVGRQYHDARTTNNVSGQELEAASYTAMFGGGEQFQKGDTVWFGVRIHRDGSGSESGSHLTVMEVAG